MKLLATSVEIFGDNSHSVYIYNSDDDDDQKGIEPPITGVVIKLHTNIELIHATGLADNAREVQIIIVQDMGQTAVQFLH
ncbi:hypothetical protein GGH94_004423 [Coemansia aciculifera]|uniref:Uncharacterized protein n=1 Tax=Coemansia aciculifera TaxID=417176 RepID=A0A9W8M595_9FUNG|nr:hypothetical protein GGH94_004423 [Coemansia aciculifera]